MHQQVRLFSVIKYESVIHEFDPYFNYRVTRYLTEEGFFKTWNFFDSFTWYPLGRVVGGTMYPVSDCTWRCFSMPVWGELERPLEGGSQCLKHSRCKSQLCGCLGPKGSCPAALTTS